MAGGIQIDASDFNTLAADLGNLAREAQPAVRVVVQKSAASIKRDAQLFVPVDTGNLRSSITYDTRDEAGAVTADIGPTADYGWYVEHGTSTTAPQAYIGPAFDRHAGEFLEALAAVVDGLGS